MIEALKRICKEAKKNKPSVDDIAFWADAALAKAEGRK
jgi:hypothetical protein